MVLPVGCRLESPGDSYKCGCLGPLPEKPCHWAGQGSGTGDVDGSLEHSRVQPRLRTMDTVHPFHLGETETPSWVTGWVSPPGAGLGLAPPCRHVECITVPGLRGAPSGWGAGLRAQGGRAASRSQGRVLHPDPAQEHTQERPADQVPWLGARQEIRGGRAGFGHRQR